MWKNDTNLASFEDVARHYLQEHWPSVEREMAWFASAPSLREAIERACASRLHDGRLHSHQQRPFGRWPQAPKQAADRLKPLETCIRAAADFDALYVIIRSTLTRDTRVCGVGDLGYYDITLRVGRSLPTKLEPKEVYLHRGTRAGAKGSGLRIDRDRVPMSDLREGLRQLLTPAQAEDVLCRYRYTLERLAGAAGGGPRKTARRGSGRCGITAVPPPVPRAGRC
jgi:hypothetical protein